jgi:Holliday junction resolvase-like predicted endonuclease
MTLDFKEIPQGNIANGQQDTFELFARDFFEKLGFEILQHPSRGADGKKDLIVMEVIKSKTGIIKIKWLVSCKHKAHSGKSVSEDDEINILERIETEKMRWIFRILLNIAKYIIRKQKGWYRR